MAVREYIGARYVPLFSDPIEWDETRAYEPLTVVINQGNSYVSKQFVPAGTPLPTTAERSNAYWLLWADFNAQIEQYRAEVEQYSGRIAGNTAAIQALNGELADEVLNRTNADTSIRNDFAADLAAEATRINEALADEVLNRTNADTSIRNDFAADLAAEATRINEALAAAVNELEQTDEELSARIDAMRLEILTSESDFKPISRVLIGNAEKSGAPYFGTGNPQGATIVSRGNVDYWIQLTDDKNFIISDVATAHVQFSGIFNSLGHGQGLSWNGDTLVISPNDDSHQLARIDVSNVNAPIELASVAYPSPISSLFTPAASFVSGTQNVAILGAPAMASETVYIYSDDTLGELVETIPLTGYDFTQHGAIQGMFVSSAYIMVAYSNPEAVLIFDRTGIYRGEIKLPHVTGVEELTEVEGIFEYAGNLYIPTSTRYQRSFTAEATNLNKPTRQQRAATLLEWALNKPIAPIADPMLSLAYSPTSEPNNMIIEIDNEALITDYGRSDATYRKRLLGVKINPSDTNNRFYFVDDALNVLSWLNKDCGVYFRFLSDYLFQLRLNERRSIVISTANTNTANVTINSAILAGRVFLLPLTQANKGIQWAAKNIVGSETQCIYIYAGFASFAGGNTFDSTSTQDVRVTSGVVNLHSNITSKVKLTSYALNIAAG